MPSFSSERLFVTGGGRERRVAPRLEGDLGIRVAVSGQHGVHVGQATSLSATGVFVGGPSNGKVGDVVWISFRVPGARDMSVTPAIIRWLRAPCAPQGAPGTGLEFVGLEEAAREAIALHVSSSLQAEEGRERS
jgi:hypothetical protein